MLFEAEYNFSIDVPHVGRRNANIFYSLMQLIQSTPSTILAIEPIELLSE